MKVSIVDKAAFKAVGLARKFSSANKDEIPALWTCFMERHREIKDTVDTNSFGLCVDGNDQAFTYVAAVETNNIDEVPEGMSVYEVPAQTYAVLTVALTETKTIGEALAAAHRNIRDSWQPNSEYSILQAPCLEYYDSRFNPASLTGEIDLYIPVRKR